jgi:hypothetical protein
MSIIVFVLSQNNLHKLLTLLLLYTTCIVTAQKSLVIRGDVTYAPIAFQHDASRALGFAPQGGTWNYDIQQPFIHLIREKENGSASFTLTHIETAPLTRQEIALINYDLIESEFTAKAKTIEQRFEKHILIEINAIRNNQGVLEKMVRYEGTLHISSYPSVQKRGYAANSVLSQGNGEWFRIGVVGDGLYKIDRDFLLNLGIPSHLIQPNFINIYGNAQGMLSENNSAPRIDDLHVLPIWIKGGEDGTFDPQDYIVFYARGPHTYPFEGTRWRHQQNKFTDTAYYFISINQNALPERIATINQSNNPITHTVSKFQDYSFLEDDTYNLNKSGKEWLGDPFDTQLSKNYSFSFANLSTSDSAELRARVVIQSTSALPFFTMSCNGQSKQIKATTPSGQGYTNTKGRMVTESLRFIPNGNTINYSLTFNKSGFISSLAWLDFVEINVTRNLVMNGNQMTFRNFNTVGSGHVTQFTMSNAANVSYIWDITNPRYPRKINFTLDGASLSLTVATDTLRTFIAATDNLYLAPTAFGKIDHQNLHGLPYADIIIITDPSFKSAADKLAVHHFNHRGLTSHVVTQQQIFNEFSSGMRDPVAIRHFLKMFYDRANGNPTDIPKYCILMGDATYDYRNKFNSNNNFVISYQSNESLNPISSFASDDFFVILNDQATMSNNELMDMAIGRYPVKNLTEALGMVQKVIRYDIQSAIPSINNSSCAAGNTASIYGDWRNRIILVSDDGDNNHYFNDIENMHNRVKVQRQELNVIKIHSDAFPETITPGGERNFGAENAIRENVQNGALMINYIGHGGETGWAHESILTVPTIQNWTNSLKMPVFMTATCEFSRYDDHDRTSAGEYVVLNENGGGIGLFTTTRLVFSSSNSFLTGIFYDTVFDKVNGVAKTLGEIYLHTKNSYALRQGDVEYRKFTLLGDPVVQLAQPQHYISTDSINGVHISMSNDTLKALSKVRISGHLTDFQGNELTGFNGAIYPTIYDKESQLMTLGSSSDSHPAAFQGWRNIVYRGKASVVNGKFTFEFIVPKDISYTVGNCRFSYYSENQEQDGHGYSHEAKMGAINTDAPLDNIGPEAQLFLNNENFVNGGLTNENPVFLAKLFDENGINTVGNGIGHNLEIRIDNQPEPIILNDYYEADLDTYKSGTIRYPLANLAPGQHVLYLKAWDVYNNSTDAQLEFTVVAQEDMSIAHLLNYPNPFTTHTEFSFETNQVCEFVDVQLQIFTITGTLVKTIQQRVRSNGFRMNGIYWDGRDDFGDKLAIGTYVYRLTAYNESGQKADKYEKLVILR